MGGVINTSMISHCRSNNVFSWCGSKRPIAGSIPVLHLPSEVSRTGQDSVLWVGLASADGRQLFNEVFVMASSLLLNFVFEVVIEISQSPSEDSDAPT